MKPITGLHPKGRLLALPENIKQGWKWQKKTNTLADYNTEVIFAIKTLNYLLIFVGKVDPVWVEPLIGLYSTGRLLALPTNVRLG
jgi:hypothetical protein